MADKKCCDNCVHGEGRICLLDPNDPIVSQVNPCEKWIRNPDPWLGILPGSNDFWFWRENDKDLWDILKVLNVNGNFCVWDKLIEGDIEKCWIPVSEIGGQWQGPIRPK